MSRKYPQSFLASPPLTWNTLGTDTMTMFCGSSTGLDQSMITEWWHSRSAGSPSRTGMAMCTCMKLPLVLTCEARAEAWSTRPSMKVRVGPGGMDETVERRMEGIPQMGTLRMTEPV